MARRKQPASMMHGLNRAETACTWLHDSITRPDFKDDVFHPCKVNSLKSDLLLAKEIVRGLEMAIAAHDAVYQA